MEENIQILKQLLNEKRIKYHFEEKNKIVKYHFEEKNKIVKIKLDDLCYFLLEYTKLVEKG